MTIDVLTFSDRLQDVVFSLQRFLNESQYTARSLTGTLKDRFANLQIITGYPEEITRLTKPTLAIVPTNAVFSSAGTREFYGPVSQTPNFDRFSISIYGFVLLQGRDDLNRLYRDRLINDVCQILDRLGGDEGMPLYKASDKSSWDSNVEIGRVHSLLLQSNVPTIEADRYKFLVFCEVFYES